MGVPFAVASVNQANDLTQVKRGYGALVDYERYARKGWVAYEDDKIVLTDAGRVARELRVILGPDRELSKMGAKLILSGRSHGTASRKLWHDGLIFREWKIEERPYPWLTADGRLVAEVLVTYKVDL